MWLSGVRRAGKTCLCQSLEDIEYFDCELPRTRRQMEDPEGFLERLRGRRVALDEVHHLDYGTRNLRAFRHQYPDQPFQESDGELKQRFVGLQHLLHPAQ